MNKDITGWPGKVLEDEFSSEVSFGNLVIFPTPPPHLPHMAPWGPFDLDPSYRHAQSVQPPSEYSVSVSWTPGGVVHRLTASQASRPTRSWTNTPRSQLPHPVASVCSLISTYTPTNTATCDQHTHRPGPGLTSLWRWRTKNFLSFFLSFFLSIYFSYKIS